MACCNASTWVYLSSFIPHSCRDRSRRRQGQSPRLIDAVDDDGTDSVQVVYATALDTKS